MCDARLDDGPLVCVRTDVHTTHSFVASSQPDDHDRDDTRQEEVR